MKTKILGLFIILIFVMWSPTLMYGKIPNREHKALQILFNKTSGEGWEKNHGWLNGVPGTEGNWVGITCDTENKTVLKIKLEENKLKGEIPADLFNLENLESLVLSNNQLTSIHEYVGRLSKLTTLDLSNNQLKGAIPRWIESLKNLKKLDLSYNRFTGGIPTWIGNLRNLEELRLDGNLLQGPIPIALGNLSKLKVLRIGHNKLTGEIPSTIRKLTRLADNKSNFKWNGLHTGNTSLRAFLKKKQIDGDWENTQTIAPGNVAAISTTRTSLVIGWTPIAYTADNGGYRVYYSTTPGGPYDKSGGAADDKTVSKLEVTGLKQSTTYYFVVQTWTGTHGSNRNGIKSKFSKVVSVTTRGITISGSVTTSEGQGIPGVEMKISDKSGTITTDADGNYILGITPGWTGTVTPSKKGYDLDPSKKEYRNVNSNNTNEDYKAEANTKISGRITDSDGNGVEGVTLTFSNMDEPAATETNSTGDYSHTVPYDWTGTVTPKKTGFKFDLPVLKCKNVISSETGKDYKAFKQPEISGSVMNRRGSGITDVTMTFLNSEKNKLDTSKTTLGGKYSKVFTTIETWSGSVTPKKSGYIFYPAKKNYQNIILNKAKREQDYKAEMDLKFFISIAGNYMIPSENSFSDIYGNGMIGPEIRAGYKLFRTLYLWGGYGFFSKKGTWSPDENKVVQTKWKQDFLSLGLGYNLNISIKLDCKAEVGVIYANYTEKWLEPENDSVSVKAVGVRIGGAGVFKISDRLFTELSVGYLFASDTIDDISIKLGGLRTGIGLGLKF